MSHFARVVNGIVTQVIVAEQDFIDSGAVGDPSQWIQTSYNSYGGVHYGPDGKPDGGLALRKNYAGAGYTYDSVRDMFIPPQPFPVNGIEWTVNYDTGLWTHPEVEKLKTNPVAATSAAP